MMRGRLNSCRTAAFMAKTRSSRPNSAQEKFHSTSHPFAQLMGTGEVDNPLPNDGVVEPFHEFSQVKHRKVSRDLSALLAFSENPSQQAERDLFGPAHVG